MKGGEDVPVEADRRRLLVAPGWPAALLAVCLDAGLLYRGLRSRGIFIPAAGWMGFSARVAIALVVLATMLWFAMGSEAAWLTMPFGERILRLSLIVTAGIGAYFATLFLLGFRLVDFRRRA